jgi:MFS family permease
MIQLMKNLLAPLSSLILMMMASGFSNTFVSIRLELEGHSLESIGIVTSSLYFGVLIGSIWIDRFISKTGHCRSFILFGLVLTASTLLLAVWKDLWAWALLRFIGGICMAGVFVVIESWFLIESGPKKRGMALSIYLAFLYAAVSLGQFLLDFSDPMGQIPFFIAALFLLLSLVPISLHRGKEPKIESAPPFTLKELIRLSPLGFIGALISGIVLAVVYGLVPIYANQIGMDVEEIASLMAVLVFGGFLLQLPLGKLADLTNRKNVLITVSILASGISFLIGSTELHGSFLYLSAICFGGFAFALYPLSMAHACERVKEEAIVGATGGLVLAYGIGAVVGPLIAPITMELWGPGGLFYFLGAVSLGLGLIGLYRSDATRESL